MKKRIRLVASILAIFWLLTTGSALTQSSATANALIADGGQNVAGGQNIAGGQNAQQLHTDVIEEGGKVKFSTLGPKLERKCGEPAIIEIVTIPLQPGFTYIRHEMRYALREPSDKPLINECKDSWNPESKTVKLTCKCRMNDMCKEEEGVWGGPKSEVQGRIIIHTTRNEEK